MDGTAINEINETTAKIKSIKRQQLELAQEENRLYNKLMGEIDEFFMKGLVDGMKEQ